VKILKSDHLEQIRIPNPDSHAFEQFKHIKKEREGKKVKKTGSR